MGPEQKFVKIWRLRNEGGSAWPEATRLAFVGGDNLSAVEAVTVSAVEPGQEVDVAVDMQSPARAGRYVSYWRLCAADGTRFGQRVWADIIVANSTPIKEEGSQAVPAHQDESTNTAVAATQNVSVQTPQPSAPSAMEVDPTPVVKLEPAVIPAMKLTPLYPTVSTPAVVPTPAPVTPVAPVAPAPVVHSPQVQQLLDMGFSDVELLKTLLAANNNDVLRTVQDLLNSVDPRKRKF
jgi:hypothetical protein